MSRNPNRSRYRLSGLQGGRCCIGLQHNREMHRGERGLVTLHVTFEVPLGSPRGYSRNAAASRRETCEKRTAGEVRAVAMKAADPFVGVLSGFSHSSARRTAVVDDAGRRLGFAAHHATVSDSAGAAGLLATYEGGEAWFCETGRCWGPINA